MADPLDINNESAFEGFLKWLGRPGAAVRNVLHGNVGGAVRQGADFLLDPIDAVLPGDILPELSRKGEDFTEASDLVGGMDPGWKKTAVDIIGGLATDPMTYVGVGPFAKAATLAPKLVGETALNLASKTAKGAELVDAGKAAAKASGDWLRSTTGNLAPKIVGEPIANATAKGDATARAAQGFIVDALKGVDPLAQKRAIAAIRGVSDELPGVKGYADLDAVAGLGVSPAFVSKADQMARIDQRLAAMSHLGPDEARAARDAAERAVDYTRGQWAGGVRDKVFSQPHMWQDAGGALHPAEELEAVYKASPAAAGTDFDTWAKGMGYNKSPVPTDLAPVDYLPGKYEFEAAAKEAAGSGSPSLIHGAKLQDSASLSKWLNANNAKLDENLPALLGDYGQRMGSAVKQAEIGNQLLPQFRSLAEDRGQFKTIIDNLKAKGLNDDATMLETAVSGLPPREGVMKALGVANKLFKPFATAGAFIPRPAFTTRNVVSSAGQIAANPEARGATLNAIGRMPKDIIGAWSDGLRDLGLPMPKPAHVEEIENAIRASGGDREAMLAAIKTPVIQDAVRLGVLDNGFVTSEKLAADVAQKAEGMKNWRNWRDWPQGLTRGAEDRMRLGLFEKLRETMPAEQAAKVVKDSLYDYAMASVNNRTARDIIPFAQFAFKAVPQQGKFLMESGAVPSLARSGIENLYNQGNGAVLPPQLQDQAVIPLGRDESGNPSYLTSFGMPYEALSQVPNLTGDIADIGPEIRHNLVASSNPGIKALYSIVSGSDPYFDSPFGSYDKAPYLAQSLGADKESNAARAWNILAGSGVVQPLASPISTLSGALDPRRSPGEAALNTLTGVRIKSVDEQQALRQLLEETLRKNPDVQRYETLYQQSPDEQTQALLEELKKVKARISAKRKADKAKAE